MPGRARQDVTFSERPPEPAGRKNGLLSATNSRCDSVERAGAPVLDHGANNGGAVGWRVREGYGTAGKGSQASRNKGRDPPLSDLPLMRTPDRSLSPAAGERAPSAENETKLN